MKAIELISVPVSDQQRSKEFYLKMGLSVQTEAPFGEGQQWIEMSFPGGGPTIALVTWFEKMPAGSLQAVIVSCDDIEKEIKRLNGNGIETGKIDETPWGKFASVADPDGNMWSLRS